MDGLRNKTVIQRFQSINVILSSFTLLFFRVLIAIIHAKMLPKAWNTGATVLLSF